MNDQENNAAPAAPAPKKDACYVCGQPAMYCASKHHTEAAPAPVAQADDEGTGITPLVEWDRLPGWLIDHHEGEILTEELLQHALADMLKVYPAQQSATPAAAVATAKADQMADRQYRAGFLAGWNAGVDGDTDKLRGVQNRVGPLSAYLDAAPADAASEADTVRIDFHLAQHTTWYPGRGVDGNGILCYGAGRDEVQAPTWREAIDAAIQRERQQGAQSNG